MTAETRPGALTVRPDQIPDALRTGIQSVVWRWTLREGKWTKPPFNPRSGGKAQSDNARTWTGFEQAVSVYRNGGDWDGIGRMFAPTDTVTGVDFDKCRDPETGVIDPLVLADVRRLNSYTEISPTGTGLRTYAHGSIPKAHNWRNIHVEVYDRGSNRYLTLTGHHLEGTPATVEDRQEMLARLHAEWVERDAAAKRVKDADAKKSSDEFIVRTETADELIRRMFAAKNGDKVRALWAGNWSLLGYPSQSEADAALCEILAFHTNGDEQQINRLFRRSGLYRGKWERADYRADTIAYGIKQWKASSGTTTPDADEPVDEDDPDTSDDDTSAETSDQPAEPRKPRFEIIDGPDFLTRPAVRYLVAGIIPEQSACCILGAPESFKSFFALELGLCLATGQPFFGRSVRQCPVLYVLAEGSAGFAQRMQAWQIARGIDIPRTFKVLPSAVQLTSREDVVALICDIHALDVDFGLIIIDTLSQSIVGANENAAEHMSVVNDNVKGIMDALKTNVTYVHHGTKADGTFRGSTSLPGALDAIVQLVRDGEMVTVKPYKSKDSSAFGEFWLKATPVDLSEKSDPDPLTTMVSVSSMVLDEPAPGERDRKRQDRQKAKLGPRQYDVLAALWDAFGEAGATQSDLWLKLRESGYTPTLRDAAIKALRQLVTRGLIRTWETEGVERFYPGVDVAALLGDRNSPRRQWSDVIRTAKAKQAAGTAPAPENAE